MSFMTLFSGVKVHGATTTPNVACTVGTNGFTSSGTLFSAGPSGTGPYIYNESAIGYNGVSTVGSYIATTTDTATVASDLITTTITNGRLNITNINGTANDGLYISYTGVANAATHTGQLYGIITGGSGKYSGAMGTSFSNGTVNTYPINNGLALAGNGTLTTVVALLLP